MSKTKTGAGDAEDEHECQDGCVCDHDIAEHEITHDRDLPEATGGVEVRARRRRATKTTGGA